MEKYSYQTNAAYKIAQTIEGLTRMHSMKL